MLQFIISWPVVMGVAAVFVELALLIEPEIPARPDGQLTEAAELTFRSCHLGAFTHLSVPLGLAVSSLN
jgi:hypothetical protein